MSNPPLIDAALAQKIVTKSPAVIYICKAYGDFAATFVTQNIDTVVGYTVEEFLSYPGFWADHVHPEDREAVFANLSQLFENGHHVHEYRFLHKDGRYRWMHDELNLITDESGEAREIMGYWNDITEIKNTADTLITTTSQLEATLNATADGLVVVNIEGVITSYNQKFLKMWDIPDQVISTRDSKKVLNYVYPQLINPDGLSQRISDLNINPAIESFDRVDFKDGKIFELHSQPQWIDNQIIGRVWSFRDVTKEENYKQELIAAKQLAEQASTAKSEFLRSMSHELRTPMNAIMGFSQLLMNNSVSALTDMQRGHVQEILDASEILLRLINELLDLSRIESGMLDISMQDTSITMIIEQCTKIIMPLADKHQVQIIDNITNNQDNLIKTDPLRLTQVVLNLMSNAVKYNQPGGQIELTIHKSSPDSLRLQVIDTGQGIAEDDLEIIFEPFERLTYKNGNIEGSGIGLNVAKILVDAIQGEIGVDSIEGEGSTFWVELPLAV